MKAFYRPNDPPLQFCQELMGWVDAVTESALHPLVLINHATRSCLMTIGHGTKHDCASARHPKKSALFPTTMIPKMPCPERGQVLLVAAN